MGFFDWLRDRFRRPSPPPPPPPLPSSDFQGALLLLVNGVRRAPLILDSRLCQAAQGWAEYMARSGRLSHGSVGGRVAAQGYAYAALGECIAEGQATAEQVFQDWMGSPGHHAILVDGAYHDVGFGRASSGGTTYWCADFASGSGPRSAAVLSNPSGGAPW